MNLLNNEGYVTCKLMSQFGLKKAKKSIEYERKILHMLRRQKNSYDFVYDEIWVKRIAKLLYPNELLVVLKNNYYYRITLASYDEQMQYYKQWCKKHNYNEKDATNLRKFIRKVKIIWES